MNTIMHLDNKNFNLFKDGKKTIEMRLNDEKRSNLNIGDNITFINRRTDEKLDFQIINLYKYSNFEELYRHHNKLDLGYKEDDIASPADMNIYYPIDKINKYGTVAIEVIRKEID